MLKRYHLHRDIVPASRCERQSLFTRSLPGTRKRIQAQPDISIFTATQLSDASVKQGTGPNIYEGRLTHIPINVSITHVFSLILTLLHLLLACSDPWRLCLYEAYAGTSRCVKDSQGLAAEPVSVLLSWASWVNRNADCFIWCSSVPSRQTQYPEETAALHRYLLTSCWASTLQKCQIMARLTT